MNKIYTLLFGLAACANPFRPYEGSPTYQEEYRGSSYTPSFIDTEFGP